MLCYVIRHLVTNVRVLCEAVLYHGLLRFLAMNPAVLVLLWIQLSVTFGYPTASKGLRRLPRAYAQTAEFNDPFDLGSPFNADYTYHAHSEKLSESRTSPYYPFEKPTQSDSSETRIISIVRVSSASVVRPKRLERVIKSVSANNKAEKEIPFAHEPTPFVFLLRHRQLNVDENVRKEFSEEIPTVTSTYSKLQRSTCSGSFPITDVTTRTGDDSTTVTDTTTTEQFTDLYTETYATSKNDKTDSWSSYDVHYSERSEKVHGEPEKVYGEPERVYAEAEKVYGLPEEVYEQVEQHCSDSEEMKYKTEADHEDPETEFVKNENHFGLPVSPENSSTNLYSLFTNGVSDKKSSFIVDNGTHRKYRVEEKTSDGFIVGEYGMVNHRDGSLRGVRYTADSNINPSIIYETLVKFLSLK